MDKIAKFLRKLDGKERRLVYTTIEKLLGNRTGDLDIKKLKGFDDIYRVRIKDLRIIFSQIDDKIRLVEISRRNEKTYRKL